MKNKILILTLALSSALLITACEKFASGSPSYNTVSRSKWTSIIVEVHWVSKDKISEVCRDLGTRDGGGDPSTNVYAGCARSKDGNKGICEVYAVEPNDFDDTESLLHFGHETWHCFGARHE